MKQSLTLLITLFFSLFILISSCDSPTRTNTNLPEVENGDNGNNDNNDDDGDGDDGDNDGDGSESDPSIINTFTNFNSEKSRYSGVFIQITHTTVTVYSQINEPDKTPHF